MIVLATALAYAGFTALCLTMERHREQIFRRRSVSPRPRRTLVVVGWMFLGISMLPLVQAQGWGLGLILWPGILTATAISLTLLLSYAPRLALAMAVTPLPAGLALL